MKKGLLGLLGILIILAIGSTSAVVMTGATSLENSTVVEGKYVPYNNNASLIPVGQQVTVKCNHSTGSGFTYNTLSTPQTVIDSEGYFGTAADKSLCDIGELLQACVYNNITNNEECSDWTEVKQYYPGGWGGALVEIFGVPEYTTIALGFVVLGTGAGLAYLRKKRY